MFADKIETGVKQLQSQQIDEPFIVMMCELGVRSNTLFYF